MLRPALMLVVAATAVFADVPRPTPRAALIVAVVSSQNAESAKAQAAALSGFVGNALKESTVSRVYPDQEALAQAVAKGEVDFALMGPLAYLRIDQKAEAKLVFRTLRNGKATYRSVIFSGPGRKTTLDAIRKGVGLKVAWVEPSSASGYLLAKAHLMRGGINPAQVFTVQDFLGSHDAVCRAVAAGTYDVGATYSDPAASGAAKVSGCESVLGKAAGALVVVATTDEVPNDVLVAAPTVRRERVELLKAAATAALKTEAGKEVLKASFLADGTAPIGDSDFDPIRQALESFAH